MKPWILVHTAQPSAGTKLSLWQRGQELSIRADGQPLMGNRCHGSETALAEHALAALAPRERPAVLLGGLGFGYTLRAALDRLPADASVTVAELVPEVIAWNRGPLAACAGAPLDDPRVSVVEGDVVRLLKAPDARFDLILLDVDNGPQPLIRDSNRWLYTHPGLVRMARVLGSGGVLGVWSARPDTAFTGQLRASGFEVACHNVRARESGKGERHVLWIATPRGKAVTP